ncbi:hypothetical protein BTN50_0021 [Candidatus Enterovibrio altilux]|uniref:Mobile element protein n=1 Tax=Candidatus Enterovibrio altilux TaxID=1927128 RepID=A0A291B6E6_9GAMM|nr:hypothetical protein BTN50_0021 [Candidatus Enterovibrio luxaltus]
MKNKKHGTDVKRLVWRKLHFVVDVNMSTMIADELSASNVTGS